MRNLSVCICDRECERVMWMYGQGYMVPSRVQTPPFFRPLPLYPISPLVHLCTTSSPLLSQSPLCKETDSPLRIYHLIFYLLIQVLFNIALFTKKLVVYTSSTFLQHVSRIFVLTDWYLAQIAEIFEFCSFRKCVFIRNNRKELSEVMETHASLYGHIASVVIPPLTLSWGWGKFTHPFGLIREAVAQNEIATVVYFYLYSKL